MERKPINSDFQTDEHLAVQQSCKTEVIKQIACKKYQARANLAELH